MVTVREAGRRDAPALAAVHVASWQAAYRGLVPQYYLDGMDPQQRVPRWRRLLDESDLPRQGTLVAVDGEVPVGFAHLCPATDGAEDVGEITAIYLHPDRWGTGAGRTLMAATVDRLVTAGYREAVLWVLPGNERARLFYERAGWQCDGATLRDESLGFPLDVVRYRRALP